MLLDRYGPRRVVATLMCVAAAGALIFGLAQDFVTLSLGRALIGLGVSAGLMGAIKAFSLWFPLSRMATLNGLYLGIGGLGGLSATAPVEVLLGPFGWRVLFYGLALASVARRRADLLPRAGEAAARDTGRRCARRSPASGRSSPRCRSGASRMPLVVCHAGYQALQGLWLAPWLYDVAGRSARGGGQPPARHRGRLYHRLGVLRRLERPPGARRRFPA